MAFCVSKPIDWKVERARIDLAAVALQLLGPPPGRRGEHGRRLWWNCPFHDDANPSFCVDPEKPWYRCYGCNAKGDAATLVMELMHLNFREALAHLTGSSFHSSSLRIDSRWGPVAGLKSKSKVTGMPEADALELVDAASARLWSPKGTKSLAYLMSDDRCLSVDTIRGARLGTTHGILIPRANGTSFEAAGIVIAWFNAGCLALVKIRQPDGRRPKYVEAYRDSSRLVCYPGPEVIRPGRPLIVAEGEFDALCLGACLGELAGVVTLGSASARPNPRSLLPMLVSPQWFIATDADAAGDRAAESWRHLAERVRPPGPYKDWTEVLGGGINLARWWGEVLSNVTTPRLFTPDEMAKWRWGPGLTDVGAGEIFPYP